METRIDNSRPWLWVEVYDVVDEETGKVVKTFDFKSEASAYDAGYHRR